MFVFQNVFHEVFLQVVYKSSQKAWFTQFLADDWFHNNFCPSVVEYQLTVLKRKSNQIRAVLLWDNCPAHPAGLVSKCGRITTKFLPPNTTSLLQPQDQGIISAFKRHYRKRFVRDCLGNDASHGDFRAILKQYNIRNAIFNAANAWNDVTKAILHNCWNKLIEKRQVTDDDDQQEDEEFFCRELDLNEQEVQEWLYNDTEEDTVVTQEILEQIENEVTNEEPISTVEDEENNNHFDVKVSDAIDGIDLNLKLMSLKKHEDLYDDYYSVFESYRKELVQKT